MPDSAANPNPNPNANPSPNPNPNPNPNQRGGARACPVARAVLAARAQDLRAVAISVISISLLISVVVAISVVVSRDLRAISVLIARALRARAPLGGGGQRAVLALEVRALLPPLGRLERRLACVCAGMGKGCSKCGAGA